MKVLYIAHYKESGGWATAAENQILALDSVGIDVVCRNVTLTADKEKVHPKLLELENKDSAGCDVCIQHVLPHHLIGTELYRKNIAFLEAESTSLKGLAWLEHLKLVDEVWVPNESLRTSLINDGISNVHLVHHPCNTNRYKMRYPSVDIPEARDRFKFYYIGDLNDRKNLDSIITCFHSEFDRCEPVVLILKVRKFGHSPEQIKDIMDKKIHGIKQSLRMYRNVNEYITDIVITEDITDDNICSLHQYCDCFVCPTHGEAWSIPTFDAMGFGSKPIASKYGGPVDYLNDSNGTLVGGSYSVCKCSDAAFPDLFTGREYWFNPCEWEIRRAMRDTYNEYKEDLLGAKRSWKIAGVKRIEEFSYEKIGNGMGELLNV